jgi:hypothetical protein
LLVGVIFIISRSGSDSQKQVQQLYEEFVTEEQTPAAPKIPSTKPEDTNRSSGSPAALRQGMQSRPVVEQGTQAGAAIDQSNKTKPAIDLVDKSKSAVVPVPQTSEPRTVQTAAPVQKVPVTLTSVAFADRVVIDNLPEARQLPVTIDLPPGVHSLEYTDTATSYTWQTQIDVQAGAPMDVTFTPEQIGTGELTIVLSNVGQFGFAFVALDGQTNSKYTTPFRIKLLAGRHKVKIFRDGFRAAPSDTVVSIMPGKELTVRCELSPE